MDTFLLIVIGIEVYLVFLAFLGLIFKFGATGKKPLNSALSAIPAIYVCYLLEDFQSSLLLLFALILPAIIFLLIKQSNKKNIKK